MPETFWIAEWRENQTRLWVDNAIGGVATNADSVRGVGGKAVIYVEQKEIAPHSHLEANPLRHKEFLLEVATEGPFFDVHFIGRCEAPSPLLPKEPHVGIIVTGFKADRALRREAAERPESVVTNATTVEDAAVILIDAISPDRVLRERM